MSLAAVSTGVQIAGLGASLLGSKKASDASKASIPAIRESADIRRRAGEVETQAIKQRSGADIAAARFRASVARDNARIAEEAGADAVAQGQADVVLEQFRVDQIIGEQRAVMAANGVVVDVGSALDLVSDTVRTGKLDKLQIKSNSERRALQLRQEGDNFSSEALLLEDTAGSILEGTEFELEASRLRTEADVLATLARVDVASAQASSTLFSGIGSALGGAGRVAAQWQTFKSQGVT